MFSPLEKLFGVKYDALHSLPSPNLVKRISFYPDGQIKKVVFKKESAVNKDDMNVKSISFYQDGEIKKVVFFKKPLSEDISKKPSEPPLSVH